MFRIAMDALQLCREAARALLFAQRVVGIGAW
jgi:hypothetical protein